MQGDQGDVPQINSSKPTSHWHQPDRVKRCISCGKSKGLSDFYSYPYTNCIGNSGMRYESRCKPCARERRRYQYAKNSERDRRTSNQWKDRNRKRLSEYSKERQKDPAHRANKARLQRLRKARLRSGSGNTPEIRAIYAEAMRIETLIQCCPVFDLPELGKKIHVDHVIPLSRGGKHEVSNLQLLPIGLNMRKGASCPK